MFDPQELLLEDPPQRGPAGLLFRQSPGRADFQRVLSEIAHLFAATPSELTLRHSLAEVGEGLGFDWCSVLRADSGCQELREIQGWTSARAGTSRQFSWPNELPSFVREILAGKSVRLSGAHEVSPDASTDSAPGGAAVVLPLMLDGRVSGAMAFGSLRDERQWSGSLMLELQTLADLFANHLARGHAELELHQLQAEVQRLREQTGDESLQVRSQVQIDQQYPSIIGKSEAIRRVISQSEQVAATESIVLLSGETGTGKELVAQLIHDLSPRHTRPMVKVNCAALPPNLVESELFGRERGAYTGAMTREIGRFELAHQSTIFLDELAELPMELQAKLLRVLQAGEFERVGSPKPIHVNVRVIAATNRDLKRAIAEGRFREDLYYRLNVFPIEIPPLRERPEDIPMLAWAFVGEFGNAMGKTIEAIPQASMEALQRYSWPGNVRELRNVIERAMIVSSGPTLRVSLPQSSAAAPEKSGPLNLRELERQTILEVMKRTRWRVRGAGGAAELLGIKPTTLEARMARLGISRTPAACGN